MEIPERSAEGDRMSRLQVPVDPGGGNAVGHVADHEFDMEWIGGVGGHGVGAQNRLGRSGRGASLELDVLAGAERERRLGVHGDAQMGDVGRDEGFADQLSGVAADGEDFGIEADVDVALDPGLAGEPQALGAVRAEDLVFFRDRRGRQAAGNHLDGAAAAETASTAGGRQEDAVRSAGFEDRCAGGDRQGSAGIDGERRHLTGGNPRRLRAGRGWPQSGSGGGRRGSAK